MCWAGVGGPAIIGGTDNGADFSLSEMQISCIQHTLKAVKDRCTIAHQWSKVSTEWRFYTGEQVLSTKTLDVGKCPMDMTPVVTTKSQKEQTKEYHVLLLQHLLQHFSSSDWVWGQGWQSG